MTKKSHGFTLVELLVVIGIIAVLVSILLPALNRARASAVMVQCQSNMKQLAQGVILYATENGGFYPSNDSYLPNPNNVNAGKNFYWWTPALVGKYVNNRDPGNGPDYVSTRVFFCPGLPQTVGLSNPRGYWGAHDMGIGYNTRNSTRDNLLYYQYPQRLPSDPQYATDAKNLIARNLRIARMGKVKRASEVLIFTDTSSGVPAGQNGEGSSRFIQMYNGCARATPLPAPYTGAFSGYGTNPAADAVSFRHTQRANVAFLDGHVDSVRSSMKDDWQVDTHKNTGLHAEVAAGRILLNAR